MFSNDIHIINRFLSGNVFVGEKQFNELLYPALETAKKEISKLFDDAIRSQDFRGIAITLMKKQKEYYSKCVELLEEEINHFKKRILSLALPCIDENFFNDYDFYRHFRNHPAPPIKIPAWLGGSAGFKKMLLEILGKLPSNLEFVDENTVRFSPEIYNILKDLQGGSYKEWECVNELFEDIYITRKAKGTIHMFLNNELNPTIEQLEQMIAAPTTEVEQDIANGKPWQENYKAVVRAFPDFGKHFDRLQEKGYITVDDNKARFTWNKGKAVLARYFDRITLDGYETQWSVVKALFENIKPADNLRAMVTRNPGSKEYSKLCDILGITENK